MRPVALPLLCAGLAAAFQIPASAQQAAGSPVTAADAIETARQAYGPPDTRSKPACSPHQQGEEIVVCAESEDQEQFRVRSSGDLDPAGVGARGGVPRAPDVGTTYPGMVVARGCFIPPCPPPMPKIIDLKAIPEAPPGSDADRVGRGLAPRGNDGGAPGPGSLPPLVTQPNGTGRSPRQPESASPAEPR